MGRQRTLMQRLHFDATTGSAHRLQTHWGWPDRDRTTVTGPAPRL